MTLTVIGYKINIHKPNVFLCTTNKQLEIKIKNTIYDSTKNHEMHTYMYMYAFICIYAYIWQLPANADYRSQRPK